MDAAAPYSPDAPEPVIGGRPVQWTLKDVAIGLGLFVGLFFVNVLLAAPFVAFGEESTPYYSASIVVTAIWELSIVAVAATLTWRKYGGGWERLGFRQPSWGTLGWIAAATVATIAFSLLYAGAINLFDLEALKSECDDQIPRALLDNTGVMVLTTITVVTFAPICEEIFFRGFVFPGFWKSWGVVVAIILTSLLFSVAHIGPNMHRTIIPILGIGIILAVVYWRSGNLWTTIGAHFANNVLAVIGLWGCR